MAKGACMALDIKSLKVGDTVVANGHGKYRKGKRAKVTEVSNIKNAFAIEGDYPDMCHPEYWDLVKPLPRGLPNYQTNRYNHMLVGAVKGLQEMTHDLAKAKGWYDPPKTDVEALALVHSEVSEAIEEIRKGNPPVYQVHSTGTKVEPGSDWRDDKKPKGELMELADVVIRILDYCEHKGLNLGEAILLKHKYNQSRSSRHGGKKL